MQNGKKEKLNLQFLRINLHNYFQKLAFLAVAVAGAKTSWPQPVLQDTQLGISRPKYYFGHVAPAPKTISEQSPKHYPKPNHATVGNFARSSRTFGRPTRLEKQQASKRYRKLQEAKVCPSPDDVFPNTYSINHKKEDCFNFKVRFSANELSAGF